MVSVPAFIVVYPEDAMKRLITCLFGALVFTAAAHAAEPNAAPAVPAADTPVAAQEEAKKPDVNDRLCLRHTGTRIASRADTRKDRKCAPAFGRAYTREDLASTGHIDIADALRALDPSIR